MKTTQILKAILFGVAAAAIVFFTPFPFRLFLIFFLIFFAFRFFGGRRRWRHSGYETNSPLNFWHNPAYTQRWHSMSDDERKIFIQKMESELFSGRTTSEK